MKIWLIRHGRTEANERHLYCGKTDLPLSEAGMAELRQRRYDVRGARFFTSGMKRTEQTLELLFGTVPHEQNTAFRELNFGVFEMQSYEKLKDNAAYQQWLSGDNEENIPPDGESFRQMRERVLAAWEQLLAEGWDTVLVTHGGVIAILMAYLFPEEGKHRYQWQPQPGAGYCVTFGKGRDRYEML